MSTPRDDDRDLRDRLRALRRDPPDAAGFEAALRRRLVAEGPPAPASRLALLRERLADRRLAWTAAAVAAGVAAFLALTPPRPARELAVATVLPTTHVAVVRLNLAADVPVDAAHIHVALPPELAFWAEGEALPERSLEWTQPLGAGDNEIPIAIRGTRPGRYRIAVTARIGDARVEDEVLIEVVGG